MKERFLSPLPPLFYSTLLLPYFLAPNFLLPFTSYYRYDLTVEEAIELGKRAILHATHRDAYSGGINNVYHVGENGWTQVWKGDTTDMYYNYYPLPAKA